MSVATSKLSDFFGRDLAGWKIGYCYLLELEHGLMGSFPAITVEGKEVVVVTTKRLLKEVWDKLKKRSAKITSLLAIGNASEGLAFNLEGIGDKGQAKPMRLFEGPELHFMCKQANPFEWAPGLAGGSTLIQEPNFD